MKVSNNFQNHYNVLQIMAGTNYMLNHDGSVLGSLLEQ